MTGPHRAHARLRQLLAVLVAVGAVAGASSHASAAGAPDQGYIVVLRDAAESRATAAEHRTRHGADVEHVYRHAVNGYAARIPARELAALRSDRRVAYVEADGRVQASATQSNATWGLDRIDARSGLDGSFGYAQTGNGVTAYVIDTGLRYTHAEFAGRARFGYDAFAGDGSDCNGHGTHVGGTVGGTTYGVAKAVELVAVRVLDCDGSGSYSGVIAGVDWVTRHKQATGAPAVANMSLGGGASRAVDEAVKASIAAGVTYAVAAGNGDSTGKEQDACNSSPARVPEAITIGATDRTDTKTSWSNYGSCVDWFAPGAAITSAWHQSDTQTNTISGTSMATPHVAGAAALYLQSNATASARAVRDALHANTTKAIVKSSRTADNHLLYVPAELPPPNTPPSASFTVACSEAACAFDGSASRDAEGPLASYAWSFGDGATAATVSPSHAFRADGTYTVSLTVTDGAGATATATHTLTIDATPPQTIIDDGPAGTIATAAASFRFSSEPGATLACRLDAADWAPCTSPRALTALADGTHTFAVRATDAAGNTDATPATRSFTIDTTPPETVIDDGPAGTIATAAASFRFSSEPGATLACRLDAADWAPCTSPRALTALADGTHTFAVRATDAAGNTDRTPATRSFTVDTAVGPAARAPLVAPAAVPPLTTPPRPAAAARPGISINDGARFTNKLRVTLRLSWPAGATHVRISGDGGFASADRLPLAAAITWTLSPARSAGARRTIHARFEASDGTPQGTYRDHIVLDQTVPRVRSARLVRVRGARRSYDVVLAAVDRASGVRRVQFASDRRRPKAFVAFHTRMRVKRSQRPRFVRVRDGAGNVSGWRTLAAPRAAASTRR